MSPSPFIVEWIARLDAARAAARARARRRDGTRAPRARRSRAPGSARSASTSRFDAVRDAAIAASAAGVVVHAWCADLDAASAAARAIRRRGRRALSAARSVSGAPRGASRPAASCCTKRSRPRSARSGRDRRHRIICSSRASSGITSTASRCCSTRKCPRRRPWRGSWQGGRAWCPKQFGTGLLFRSSPSSAGPADRKASRGSATLPGCGAPCDSSAW